MAQTESDSFSMRELRWKNRPLVIFAPSPEDPRYREQVEKLRGHVAGLEERDMVLLHLFEARGVLATPEGGEYRQEELSREATNALRARYGAREGELRVILVGKDGGSKLDSSTPLEPGALFSRIDGMPMRQREMRSSGE